MNREKLIELEDHSEETDRLGRDHVQWPGPCYVCITDSICAFFGIHDLEDSTEEALAVARTHFVPQPATQEVLTVSVKVHIRVAPGADISTFIENLDFTVISNTPGITVYHTDRRLRLTKLKQREHVRLDQPAAVLTNDDLF